MINSEDAGRYIRRETAISMVINTMLTLFFYALVFGRSDPVIMWGVGQWVFDFAPQSFMIALMSTLVPGSMVGRAARSGKVAALPGVSALPANLLLRAALLAVCATVLGVALVAGVVLLLGVGHLPLLAALSIKAGYGALLAAIITPVGLRAALKRPILQQEIIP